MKQIAIVTDSTSDLPAETYEGYDLTVIPLTVLFEDKVYIDNGIDIKPEDFYKMIQDSTEMPKASQPTPGDFLKVYDSLNKQGKDIISIHISRKLSGTLNSAELALKQLGREKVEIIDSEFVHMPCGFLVLKAAELARNGNTKAEILDAVDALRKEINSLFIPRSLDNLIKGGRVTKLKGMMANLLDVKPILTLKDGEVSLYKNSRKWELAKKEVLDIMESLLKGKGELTVSIGDVGSRQDADEVEARIQERFKPASIIRTSIGIVVGSHLGIGGLGITFFEQ